MKVVLNKDVKNMGRINEIIEVSDGYARNFLIPQKIADPATPEILAKLKIKRSTIEEKAKTEHDSVLVITRGLNKLTIDFSLPADDKGHLYSGLKEIEILGRIRTEEPKLSKKAHIVDYKPIRMTGKYKLAVNIGFDQLAEVNIIVKGANEAK